MPCTHSVSLGSFKAFCKSGMMSTTSDRNYYYSLPLLLTSGLKHCLPQIGEMKTKSTTKKTPNQNKTNANTHKK